MRYLVLIFVIVLMSSCGSGKSKATPEQMNNLYDIIEDRRLEIISKMAYPQATSAMLSLQNSGIIAPGSYANQISLIGNENFLEIVGDSIFAKLPYFGERRMNATFNESDASITIKNVLENYSVEKRDNNVLITFSAKTQSELFDFHIIIYPSLKTSMIVNGISRVPIRYSGLAQRIE